MRNETEIRQIVIGKRREGWDWQKIRDFISTRLNRHFTVSGIRGVSNRKGWLKEINSPSIPTPQASEGPVREIERKFTKNAGEITTKSLDLKTLDDVLEYAQVDLSEWGVERYIINSWETTISASVSDTGKTETFTNYQVKIWLRKIIEDNSGTSAVKDMIADLMTKDVRILPRGKQFTDEVVMFLGIFDHHFGKLCWRPETTMDYDLDLAYKAFTGAVEDLIDRSRVYNISKIVFPLGNDYFQMDSFSEGTVGMTTKGTPQDTDGRLAKIWKTGMKAIIEAIELCAQVAPVEVIYIPGNHDWNMSFYLCNIVEARFHNSDRVTVDLGPNPRKYRRYGKVLVGLTHGNEEKHADLPAIMAGEAKKDWAQAEDYMWFLGHYHRRKEMRFNAGDTFGAVQVRILPSLSGTDAWHHKKGYVKSDRAAEAYYFHPREGYIGHSTVKIRPEFRGETD